MIESHKKSLCKSFIERKSNFIPVSDADYFLSKIEIKSDRFAFTHRNMDSLRKYTADEYMAAQGLLLLSRQGSRQPSPTLYEPLIESFTDEELVIEEYYDESEEEDEALLLKISERLGAYAWEEKSGGDAQDADEAAAAAEEVIEGEGAEGELDEEEEEEEEELGFTEEPEEELIKMLREDTLEEMINRMATVAVTKHLKNGHNYEDQSLRKRLEPFINEDEVNEAHSKPTMKRTYSSRSIDRSPETQLSREKNNNASRLSRIRLTNAEKNLRLAAVKIYKDNMEKRMRNGVLFSYLQLLHTKLKLAPIDFDQPMIEIVQSCYELNWENIKKSSLPFPRRKEREIKQ